jgi:hypothetical protein
MSCLPYLRWGVCRHPLVARINLILDILRKQAKLIEKPKGSPASSDF